MLPLPAGQVRVGRGLVALSFVAGFAVMNSEIAAGRLLAPYYGTSSTTWALLIGTVLASMAVGNLLGGALSRRAPRRWIVRVLVLAGFFLALLPLFGPRFMAGTLALFRGGELGAIAVRAVGVAALLSLPMLALGAVSPLILQLAGSHSRQDELGHSLGKLASRLFAAGTIGSLAGTYASGLLFIPWLGTSMTIHIGALLVLAAAAVAGATWRLADGFALAGAALALLVLGVSPALTAGAGAGVIYRADSRYNYIEVIDAGADLELRVNDGYAVQSYARKDGGLPLRGVWGYYALASTWAEQAPRRVLLLGLGGGTSAHAYRRLYPDAEIVGVELDGEIVQVGRDQLGLDLDGVDIEIEDARSYVVRRSRAGSAEPFDVIILDAFQFPYIPFHLATREFFAAVRGSLAPGGVFMMNVGRHGEQREVVRAVAATLAEVFPRVSGTDADNDSNTILLASYHRPHKRDLRVGEHLSAGDRRALERAHRGLGDMVSMVGRGGRVLTDDHAPVEWMTDRVFWTALVEGGG